MTPEDVANTAGTLATLTMDLHTQPAAGGLASRVTDLAVKLIPCAAADIVEISPAGKVRITASSDEELSALTEKVWRRWPLPADRPSAVYPLATEQATRGSYVEQLRCDTGIVEELTVPLRLGAADHGYLRFLSTDGSSQLADARELASAFVLHAVIALDRAALRAQVNHLQLALDNNRQIGAAIGILMARSALSYSEAFSRLTKSSQDGNRKLRDVAADVLYVGQLPA